MISAPREHAFSSGPLTFFLMNAPLLLYRLVNENEVKQWKEQAEKMRKGKWRRPDKRRGHIIDY